MQLRTHIWVLSVCVLLFYQASAAADAAARSPATAAASGQSRLPPLIAALNALRPTISISNSTTRSRPSASASSQAAPRAAATSAGGGPPLDTLRPAAAAALARQQSGPNAVPLTDDDIAAINILLGREEPPSRPYAYDTGLPVTGNTTASVPRLLTFGNHTPSKNDSSMQSSEKLSKMRSLGPLSWLARQYHISGSTLLKLRITQQLQLILGDAISDSAASNADLPPNQVVTFASGNLSMSLGFTGVDWDDGLTAGTAAMEAGTADAVSGLPHAGLVAVQKAIQELTGNFDPGHTLVSFEPLASSAAAAAAAKPAAQQGSKQPAANSARKLLLSVRQQQQQQQAPASSSSRRRLAAASIPATLKVVHVQLYGMDPMNLTSLIDRLANCSAQQPSAAAPGRMPEMAAGAPLAPWCADTFRKHFQQQGVAVAPGPAFKVAAQDKAQAAIGLAVAIGVTQDQQLASGTDTKAAAWLNGTSMQDIFGTFNLTVASSDADYVSYLRDKQSGLFPSLPGLNLETLIPSLLQTVLAANRSGTGQQQQQKVGSSAVGAAAPAMNRAAMAGIIVACVASVLALAGVVVLLLRRRSDSRNGVQQEQEGGAGAGPNRRRKRRPRLYHTKYLPNDGPVLGPEPQSDAASPLRTAAAAADGPRHKLERGDSVTSQVHIEMDEAQDEDEDSQSSVDAGSSSEGSTPSAAAAAAAAAALRGAPAARHHSAGGRLRTHRHHQQQQQQQQHLQKQEGIAASGGSTVSTANSRHSGSTGSSSVVLVPADSSAWGDEGSGSMRTVSVDLTANSSSVLSPWESQGEVQGPAAAGEGKQGRAGSVGGRHRLAVVSQVEAAPEQQQQQQGQDADGCSSSSGGGAVVGKQQQQLAAGMPQPAAAVPGSFSMASAFAAMDAQLAAAVRAGAVSSNAGSSHRRSSGGGSMSDVQPLGMSAWHKGGHVSGFLVPEATAASSGGGSSGLAPLPPGLRRSTAGGGGGGHLVSPFAAAIQLANSVASDDVV